MAGIANVAITVLCVESEMFAALIVHLDEIRAIRVLVLLSRKFFCKFFYIPVYSFPYGASIASRDSEFLHEKN